MTLHVVLVGLGYLLAAAGWFFLARAILRPPRHLPPGQYVAARASKIEQRTVCDRCGQQLGLFHKDCAGRWVKQCRTVTEWETVGPDLDALPDVPTEGLRRLVERHRLKP